MNKTPPHAPQVRLATEDSLDALALCAAFVNVNDEPHGARVLRPLPLLIDTAMQCIYKSPRTDEEALELMTSMYKARLLRQLG